MVRSLVGHPGYCGVTGDAQERGCVPDKKQGWFSTGIVRLEQCLQTCAKCDGCHYVSFSKRMNDCSWYARCNLQRLKTANGQHHRSYRMRHDNGTILAAITAQLARRLSAPATNGSLWVREPARRVFFHEEDPEMIYLHSERPNFRGDQGFQQRSRADSNGPIELLRE